VPAPIGSRRARSNDENPHFVSDCSDQIDPGGEAVFRKEAGKEMIEVIIVGMALLNTFALGMQVGRWMESK